MRNASQRSVDSSSPQVPLWLGPQSTSPIYRKSSLNLVLCGTFADLRCQCSGCTAGDSHARLPLSILGKPMDGWGGHTVTHLHRTVYLAQAYRSKTAHRTLRFACKPPHQYIHGLINVTCDGERVLSYMYTRMSESTTPHTCETPHETVGTDNCNYIHVTTTNVLPGALLC